MMLAKRRIIRATGFVKMPNSSMTAMMGLSQPGTSGRSISFQYSLLPNTLTIMNVQQARKNVTAMLPVMLADPGMRPMRLLRKMKKNAVSR